MSDTAFPNLEIELGRQVREAKLDHDVFQMPLKVCELTRCRATCCHDGVYLSPEEKDTLARVIDERAETLAGYGWSRRSWTELREGRVKTQTVDAESGHMACGDDGSGRLAEPLTIVEAVEAALGS